MKTIALAATSLISLLWLTTAPTTAHAATLRTIALSGQPALGTASDVNYSSFSAPVLNDAGQTAFLANLSGSSVDSTNDRGFWSEGSSSLALVAREGSQAPGTPIGVNFASIGVIRLTATFDLPLSDRCCASEFLVENA